MAEAMPLDNPESELFTHLYEERKGGQPSVIPNPI
jgi:hypothetical protein